MNGKYEQLRIIPDADGDFVAGSELTAVKQFIALCARGPAAEIETALRRGALSGARDERGVTPLMAALNSNSRQGCTVWCRSTPSSLNSV